MFGWWQRYRLRRQMRASSAPPGQRGFWGTVLSPVTWILSLPGRLFSGLGHSAQTLMDFLASSRRSPKDLLLAVPAMLALVAVMAATAMGHSKQSGNGQRYWIRGNQLLQDGDHAAAQDMLRKALGGDNINRRDVVFSLARAYEDAGDAQRADALMESLATVGTAGHPSAHRYLAIRTARQVAATKQVDDLVAWQWHLSHADQPESPELQKSWGYYYLIAGDLESSADHFRRAAEDDPSMWLQVAEIQARMNDMDAVRVSLATARQQLEKQFLKDPANNQNRLLYATSLFYIGDLPNAERLLKQGIDQQEDDASFRKLLAAVFVRMFDVEAAGDGGIGKAFRYLAYALQYDPGYQPALQRLVTVARSSPDRLDISRKIMRKLIADGEASAMGHFALGSLEWIAGNQDLAKLNMTQAITLDPKLAVVANNLAYLMAQEESPDLDSALNLADQAVDAEPGNADFLDTRAMVHKQRGDMAAAAADYQRALESSTNPNPIRMELAEIYDQLGDPEMAAQFRAAAQ
ncbi:tetratricopeptide repeat protein [Crateriforma conspicua]|uniref:tetratricopeptide repeat protein n=1 Tax=Crateriforma conspicua TaxID=2527996 RepID=UPI00118ACD91|nr:tetratricopeptide repeat protein [Crateriforma conspicua]QDV65954.1 Tetratricopeptide repeat protein [Crateriforma conspicua]